MSELIKLFIAFFQIGLFTIGGGMASVPLMREIVSLQHGWLSPSEFIDLITISEMTPGPIAINSATFVGTKIAGFPGALVATLGNIIPSLVIVILLAKLYFKYKELSIIGGILEGLRPAVVGMIASAVIGILTLALFQTETLDFNNMNIQPIRLMIFGVAFIVVSKFKKINPILVILLTGVVSLVIV